jgi:inhibitor of KinA sporulation pathway (predicted exonuclease)
MTAVDAQHEHALYIDLEWNCWDAAPIPGRHQEIIEIGVVEVRLDTLEMIGEKDYLIRPRLLDISAACTQITGLTAEDLKQAPPFPDVLRQFEEDFQPQGKLCCAWGNDASVLDSACSRHKVPCPLRNRVDVGLLFWHIFLLKDQPSLRKAIEIIGIPYDGIAHTALGDARNTARVHAEIIRRMKRESVSTPIAATPSERPRYPTVMAEKLGKILRS